jgi:predicted nuclease of predicted toxin-antitoxin system
MRTVEGASDQADLREASSQIIWLRLGNCSTKAIEALLRSRASAIEEFLADEQKSFLNGGQSKAISTRP